MRDDASKHKEYMVGFFGQMASTYDRIGPPRFAHFGRRLVDLAHILVGARVLDVATGTGAVLFPAIEQVGLYGHVIGIDLTEQMVRATAAEISRRGISNAEVRQMDAEHLEFPNRAFDVVLCGFALHLFPDLHRALAEIRRVLRPGGSVAVSRWGEQDEPSKRFGELVKAYGCEPQLAVRPLRSPTAIQTALEEAGFTRVRVTAEEVDFVYADEEEWWGMVKSGGPPGASLERMTPETLERFKSDALAMMQAFKKSDGLHHPRRVLYTVAVVPG